MPSRVGHLDDIGQPHSDLGVGRIDERAAEAVELAADPDFVAHRFGISREVPAHAEALVAAALA